MLFVIMVVLFESLAMFVDTPHAQNVSGCIFNSGDTCFQDCRQIIVLNPLLVGATTCNQTCLFTKCVQRCVIQRQKGEETPRLPDCPLMHCNSTERCSQQCAVGRCVCISRGATFTLPGCDQKCDRGQNCRDLTCISKSSCVQTCRGGSCHCKSDGTCTQLCTGLPCTTLQCTARFCSQETKNCSMLDCSSSACVQQCDAGKCDAMKCNSEWCSQICKKNTSICLMQGKATKELKQICEGNCSATCTGEGQCKQTCHSNSQSCALMSSTKNRSTQTCEATCVVMACASTDCTQICKNRCRNMTCSGTTCKQYCQEGGCRMECTDSVNLCVQNCESDNCTFICNAKRCQICSKGNCTIVNNKVMVDKKIINITVKQMEDVKLNCTLQGGGVTWKQGDGSEIILSNRIKIVNNLLIISNASLQDAGEYVCSKMTPQGIVSYQVNVGVNVTINVYMALRILNWNFIKAYENESSPEYKNFTNHFKHQMDIVYKDLGGYIGVEIFKIFNGSLRMRFRVIVVVTVKNKVDSVTGMKVRVTQKVVIRARNGWVESLQVDKDPKYMELYQSPPPPPENVTVVETLKDGAEVAWDLPLFHEYYFIKGYFIEYWKFSSETKERTRTLPGKRTKLTDLESDTAYAARVVAENINGIQGEKSQQIDIKTKSGMPNWLLAVVIICVIFLIVVLTGIIVYCRRKNSRKNAMENFTMEAIRKEEAVEYVQPKSYVNNMFVNEKCQNFPREDLVLLEELGSGEFGVVFKGQLLEKGESKECAVKTLKGQADPEDYRELYQELEIMANIGHHPNLVNLIGSCIENEKLFVIVEFARYGSLIDFLRKARTDSEKKSEFELNYFNRLKIALNVAKGMSYLAQKRCVHRDLAARNVLLADNFVAKVADFGLSRDIYETGEYEKTTGGKLPTRWMAIESLELRRFTLQSDVWSFGVLLWEIETKGLMPHGAIAYIELLEKQKKGYRLEQPNGTPDELYHLMQMCWQANPRQRPTFPKICDTLKIMLNNNQVPNGTEPEIK